MLTTSNLKLRQAEVKKNINENFRQMRKQAVGGLGALIEKPNAPVLKKPFVPTIFTPAPMTSSLPYLSDDVKMRSNENVLMLAAHIAQQKEVRKASLYLDDLKTEAYQQRLQENMVVKQNIAPNDKDLMTRFLVGEIQKRKREEQKIEDARRSRVDLGEEIQQIVTQPMLRLRPSPINISVLPTVPAIDAMRAEDLGKRVDLGAREEELKGIFESVPKQTREQELTGLFDKAPKQPKETLKGLLERVKGRLLPQGRLVFRPNLEEVAKDFESQLVGKFTNKELDVQINKLKSLGFQLPKAGKLQARQPKAEQIIKAKRLGLPIKIDVDVGDEDEDEPVRAVGGGTVGGGAFATILRGSLQ